MNSIKKPLILYLLCCFFLLSNSHQQISAQNTLINSKKEFLNFQKASLLDTLSLNTPTDYPYITGYNYINFSNEYIHPYFKENKWSKGSLVYSGNTYNVDGIKYDIQLDNLVILFNNNDLLANLVALDRNFITEFTLQNSKFKYYDNLKYSSEKKLKSGYYEVVYDGKLKFLVRNEKYKTLNDFNFINQMFLLKDGIVINVNSLGKLISLLKDKEKSIKDFIDSNSLTLSQLNYTSASKILKYYESL